MKLQIPNHSYTRSPAKLFVKIEPIFINLETGVYYGIYLYMKNARVVIRIQKLDLYDKPIRKYLV